MRTAQIEVRRCTIDDLEVLVPLFDAYRQFYRQPSDPGLARRFLLERLQRDESTVLLAVDAEGAAVGFAQLFPSYSSVSAAPILILNDLFVASNARRAGVGKRLLLAAADYGREVGAVRLTLSTEVTNSRAQALYESEGWRLQEDFYVYDLPLES